ncbi:MAG: hypothetical protein AB7O74_09640 [Candidatus Nanopelagicales bacterium]
MSTMPEQPTVPLDADPTDVLEQAVDAVPADPDAVPTDLGAREADPADVLEQQLGVPLGDDERDPA